MTAIFVILLSWGIMTAKTRRHMVAVATAGAVAVMLVSPPRVYAQGLWAAIQAVLKVINGIIQTALNSINSVRSAMSQFYHLTVWPRQLINQARSLVTQMINQYRAPMTAIFNIRLQSARLASTQQLETLMRNAQTADFPALRELRDCLWRAAHDHAGQSSGPRLDRPRRRACPGHTENPQGIGRRRQHDTQHGRPTGEQASQAAPGSAPFLTATAVAASVRTQALTQKMLAAELRQEAAELAHRNTLRKERATFTSQVSTSIQNTLQPQQ